MQAYHAHILHGRFVRLLLWSHKLKSIAHSYKQDINESQLRTRLLFALIQ